MDITYYYFYKYLLHFQLKFNQFPYNFFLQAITKCISPNSFSLLMSTSKYGVVPYDILYGQTSN